MPMDFELTISGLCVIVMRSPEDRPTRPDVVDVLCVSEGHRPRLCYLPEELVTDEAVAELVVDPAGRRIAFLDITNQALTLSFGTTPHSDFSVTWGAPDAEAPQTRAEDAWMNWVPLVQDLGFNKGLRLGQPGELVEGAGAVLSLPKGRLSGREVVRERNSDIPFLWKFPAAGGKKRAIANQVVFRADGVADAIFSLNGNTYLTSSKAGGILQVAISADLPSVLPDYPEGSDKLDHLGHIAALAASRSVFQAPELVPPQRTGHPICNQALFITKG